MPTAAILTALLALLALTPESALGADFRPITNVERAYSQVPFAPDAGAVVLFSRGELRLMDYPVEVSSSFDVEVRIKILSEVGKEAGEVEIPHSRFYRLKKIKARTVLPDGREIEVPEEAIFRERRSRSEKHFVTKLVFPAVEVGAILDYRYQMRWDSLFFLEPWYFDDHLPTLLSEITYVIPKGMAIKPWSLRSTQAEMKSELTPTAADRRLRVWMENLKHLPQEPFSYPPRALASRIMMVPLSVNISGDSVPLLETWKQAAELFDAQYVFFKGRKSQVKKRAGEIARAEASQRARIEALYRFVRDEIRTVGRTYVGLAEGRRADAVLKEKQGTDVEKALVLEAMLDTLKLKTALVWATRRSEGLVDMSVANPWWIDRTLVSVELEGQRIFLDPSNRALAPGSLEADFEGAQAVVLLRKPEVVTLPARDFEHNKRRVEVDLTLDDEGRLSGTGAMNLEGHHAVRRLRWKDDADETREAWLEWLEGRFPGYEARNVSVEESVENQTVRVAWSMAQLDEEVLGDEATLTPSRPFGPFRQPLSLVPTQRRTPTLLDFPYREELVTIVRWPAGWTVEAKPQATRFDSSAGSVVVEVEHDPASRKLTFSRSIDLRQALFTGRDEYKVIRDLFGWIETSDAQRMVLAAP